LSSGSPFLLGQASPSYHPQSEVTLERSTFFFRIGSIVFVLIGTALHKPKSYFLFYAIEARWHAEAMDLTKTLFGLVPDAMVSPK
jgi:hypothetical protein